MIGSTMANSHRDVAAITQLVNLYGLAVDSRQWHLFDSICTADVDADYGASGAQGCRWQPTLERHGLVRRHVGAHPGWLADLRPDLPHHLVDR
jgi:hypothetical protein